MTNGVVMTVDDVVVVVIKNILRVGFARTCSKTEAVREAQH
jgi:hypothetical protein